MGKRILSLAQKNPEFIIHGAVEHPGHPDLGKDVGSIIDAEEIGVSVTDTLTDAASGTDVIIDFSIPDAVLSNARCAAENGIAFVIGTTGLGENDVSELKEITRTISCIMAPNMSVGVNLLFSLVKKAAAALGDRPSLPGPSAPDGPGSSCSPRHFEFADHHKQHAYKWLRELRCRCPGILNQMVDKWGARNYSQPHG